MLIHKERLSGTASSGALTLTTAKFFGHRMAFLQITPATATTTWDLTITDMENDDIVWSKSGEEGTMRYEMRMPLRGKYKFIFANVSVDEALKVHMGLEEEA